MFFRNKKLEAELQANNKELASLKETRADLINEMIFFAVNENGKITDVNDHFCKVMGRDSHQLIGHELKSFMHKHVIAKDHTQRLFKAISEWRHWHGAIQVVAADGKELWLRSVLQPFRTPNDERIFEIYAAELTRTISQSREQEDMMAALHRSSAIIEFSLDGTILSANDNFLSAMNYRMEQIKGKHHRIFCSEEEVNSPSYKDFWRRLSSGEYFTGRFQRFDSYGNSVWLEASYNPVHDDDGRLYKVAKLASVITDQVEREQAIAETSDIAYEVSTKTFSDAAKGIEVLDSTNESMAELAQKLSSASDSIQALNDQSAKISSLVESIQGIADQTNLLALNAAIEAARAGEQGRGFAVVADEVRQLASRTSSTTEQIIAVVTQNTQLTEKAVSQVQLSISESEKARELSHDSDKVMNDIQHGAQQVVDAVSQFKNRL